MENTVSTNAPAPVLIGMAVFFVGVVGFIIYSHQKNEKSSLAGKSY